jgi:hypothetical protein
MAGAYVKTAHAFPDARVAIDSRSTMVEAIPLRPR